MISTKPYHDVGRYFLPFNTEEETELQYHYFSDDKLLGGFDWPELLQKRRAIILAEAGAGKTAEMINQANRIRKNGDYSFYTTVNELGRKSLRETLLTSELQKEFDEWYSGNARAYVFADSIDEARHDGQNFLSALGNIEKDLAGALNRTTIILSSRITDWHGESDLLAFKEILCKGLKIEPQGNVRSKSWELLEPLFSKEVKNDEDIQLSNFEPIIVSIAPLSSNQAKLLSEWNGVTDTDSFIQAIYDADAQNLANRPQDLLALTELWKQRKRIGQKSEILEWSIRLRLSETNERRLNDSLSENKALDGAKLIAASLTFGKKRFVAWPIQPSGQILDDLTLNPKNILTDWGSVDQFSLMNRAIFDPATLGRVRFHHRSVQEYLTTLWLRDIIKAGCPRRIIWNLFYSNTYGEHVIRPSYRPMLSWLAQMDEWFRKKVQAIAPELLFEEGDPSLLTISERSEALKNFCDLYANCNYAGIKIHINQISRIVTDELSEVISTLWSKSSQSAENRQLLLRLIWIGKLKGCSEIAVSASKCRKNEYEQLLGIRALQDIGSPEELNNLSKYIKRNGKSLSNKIIGEALKAIFPKFLSSSDLEALFIKKKLSTNIRTSLSDLDYNFQEIYSTCDLTSAVELIFVFNRLVFEKPDTSRARRKPVNSKQIWLIDHGLNIIARIFTQNTSYIHNDEILEIARKLSNSAGHLAGESNEGLKAINDVVSNNRILNRKLFWRSIELRRLRKGELDFFNQAYEVGQLWSISEDDFDWLLTDIIDKEVENDQFIALTAALYIWSYDRNNIQRLETLRRHAEGKPQFLSEIDKWVKPVATDYSSREKKWEWKSRKSQKKWNKQKKTKSFHGLIFTRKLLRTQK